MNIEDYNKMSNESRVSYWLGRLLLGIGSGQLRSEIFEMMDYLTRDAYARGAASVKEKK